MHPDDFQSRHRTFHFKILQNFGQEPLLVSLISDLMEFPLKCKIPFISIITRFSDLCKANNYRWIICSVTNKKKGTACYIYLQTILCDLCDHRYSFTHISLLASAAKPRLRDYHTDKMKKSWSLLSAILCILWSNLHIGRVQGNGDGCNNRNGDCCIECKPGERWGVKIAENIKELIY